MVQERAEMFGLMTVSQDGANLECEFRHLSLAEYLTALHVHITGDTLQVCLGPAGGLIFVHFICFMLLFLMTISNYKLSPVKKSFESLLKHPVI